jgi:hypothetical protein
MWWCWARAEGLACGESHEGLTWVRAASHDDSMCVHVYVGLGEVCVGGWSGYVEWCECECVCVGGGGVCVCVFADCGVCMSVFWCV